MAWQPLSLRSPLRLAKSAITLLAVPLLLTLWPCPSPLGATQFPLQPDQQHPPESGLQPLVVGYNISPPFVIKDPDGSIRGLTVELWRAIAATLNLSYELREMTLTEVLSGIQDGQLDVVAAALTVTGDRSRHMNFTHPFFISGLGIAVVESHQQGLVWGLLRFFSLDFLKAVLALFILLMGAGMLVWTLERHHNPDQFGGKLRHGLFAGLWWSAVTMTTVGYGDKAPVTHGGRLVALIWMFTSIIIISSFTASIASSLTVDRLQLPINGPDDLPRIRVGTVAGSTSEQVLQEKKLSFQSWATIHETLEALTQHKVDAVVYDAPILRYMAQHRFRSHRVRVLHQTFQRQDYAIALPKGSALRDDINPVLLDRIASPWWMDVQILYQGE